MIRQDIDIVYRVEPGRVFEVVDMNGNFVLRIYSDGSIQFSRKVLDQLKKIITDTMGEFQGVVYNRVPAERYFANRQGVLGYYGFDWVAEEGILFKFLSPDGEEAVEVSLNGVLLKLGKVVNSEIVEGDYVWVDQNYNGRNYKNLVLKEGLLETDWLEVSGLIDFVIV